MTNEEALDKVKYLSSELTRMNLSREETLERINYKDEELSKEILAIIHEYPIMYDPEIKDYRIETEEEIKIRRHSDPKAMAWLNNVHPFVR